MWWPSHERPKQSLASSYNLRTIIIVIIIIIIIIITIIIIIIIIIIIVVVVIVDDDTDYWVYLSSDHLFQVYYKVRQVLLQSATAFFYYKVRWSVITKCDDYYKVRQYMVIFSTFFFRQYRPVKCVLRYSRSKKPLFYAKKIQEDLKVEKMTLFKRGQPIILFTK